MIRFSIINLSRTRPAEILDLLNGVLALTQKNLVIPVPRIVEWADAIEEHFDQSDGRATGKTVVRLR